MEQQSNNTQTKDLNHDNLNNLSHIQLDKDIDKISVLSGLLEKLDINSPEAKELLKDYEEPKAFDKVGFARPLGGFFYQFFYAIIG